MANITISREGASPISILQDKYGTRVFSRESDDAIEDIKKEYIKNKDFKSLLPKQLSSNQKIEKNTVSSEYSVFAKNREKVIAYASERYKRNYSTDGTVKKVIEYALTKIGNDLDFDGELKEVTDFLSTNGYIKPNSKIPKIIYFGIYEGKDDSFPRYLSGHIILPYELNMDTFAKQTGIDKKWCVGQQDILKRMLEAYTDNDASKVKDLSNEYGNEYDKVCGRFIEFYNTLIGKLFSSKGGVDWLCYGDYADYLDKDNVNRFIKSVSRCSEPFVVAPWCFNIAKFKNGQLFREVKFGLSYLEEDVDNHGTGSTYYLDISKVYKCNKTGLFGTGITLERDGKTF